MELALKLFSSIQSGLMRINVANCDRSSRINRRNGGENNLSSNSFINSIREAAKAVSKTRKKNDLACD